MEVYIDFKIWVEERNAFQIPSSFDAMRPITFTIIEDSTRLLIKHRIYYTFSMIFHALKGASYRLIFQEDSGLKELIELYYTATLSPPLIENLVQI